MIIQCIMHWFYILFKKNCDCLFFKGAFVPVPRQVWVLWPTKLWKHRLLTSTEIWVFIRDCSLALFGKKPVGGLCVFPFFFPRTSTKKNNTKKKGFAYFLVPKSFNSNLTPPKKDGWRLGKVCFFWGGRQTRPYHWTPFFGKAVWRLRRHLCPDHHLSTGHHPPENAGVTPWYFEHGWLENGPIDDVFSYWKWGIFN